MKRMFLSLVTVSLIALPTVVLAGGFSIEYDQRELLAPFVVGTTPVSLGFDVGHSLGLKATYDQNFREDRWNWNVGAGYNFGSWTNEASNGSKQELPVNGWYLRAGIDRQFDVGPAMFFCGPGLQWQSSTGTYKETGSPDQDAETYNIWGINTRIGTYIPFTDQNYGFVASAGHTAGFGSADAQGATLSQTENGMNFNAGLRFQFD